MSKGLKGKPRLARATLAHGLAAGTEQAPQVDREGGDFGGGVIRGYAICTRGEALGHGMWCDGDFLQQIVDGINAQSMGVKSRFTHPGLSSDGLGKFLGRTKSAYLDGDVARGDLHLSTMAQEAPDGNLAKYVLDFAEKDPAAFGASIVFEHDVDGEYEFMTANGGVFDPDSWEWEGFTSPDPENVGNLPHSRLAELRASDVVDDPAANPTGLFHRQEQLFEEASSLCAFGLGLTDKLPAVSSFDVHPERLRGFVSRFLNSQGLEIKRKENSAMSEPNAAPADDKGTVVPKTEEAQATEEKKPDEGASDPKPETVTSAQAACKEFIDAFGAQGGVWFSEGKTFKEAQSLHSESLRKENEELKARLQQVGGGQHTPLSFGGSTTQATENPAQNRLEGNIGRPVARFAQAIKLPGNRQ